MADLKVGDEIVFPVYVYGRLETFWRWLCTKPPIWWLPKSWVASLRMLVKGRTEYKQFTITAVTPEISTVTIG